MELTQDNITLRLIGGDIDPSNIKIGQLGPIFYNYERALIGIIASNTKERIDQNNYYLTLNSVSSGTATYGMIAFSPNAEFNPAIVELDRIIKTKDVSNIDDLTVSSIDKLTGWLRTHKCDAEIYLNGSLATVIPQSFVVREIEFFIKEYTTIHGIIIDVGKLDPRIEIRLINGDTLFFDIKKEQAIELGKHLYQKTALIGEAEIYPRTFKIHSFRLEDFRIISDDPYIVKFDRLRGLLGTVWNEIENPVEYLDLNG